MYLQISFIGALASVLLTLQFSKKLHAQARPEFPQSHYIDTVTGKIFWNRNNPFAIKLIGTTNNDEVLLQSDQADAIFFDSEGLNTINSPWLINPNTKQTVTPQTEVQFNIYVDGLPPSIFSKYTATPKYTSNKKVYFGKGLRITLSTNDAMSGIRDVFYSINGQSYQHYNEEIPIKHEGAYSIKYFAVDNVGNVSNEGEREFIVDTASPKSYHNITDINLNNNIISASTQITLSSEDQTTGVSAIYYSIDSSNVQVYGGESIFISNLTNGDHVLKYYSVDNVKNKEVPKEFSFYLDKMAPILSSDILGDRFLVNDQIYFSGRTKMKLTAIDNKSGVKMILYSINEEDYQTYSDPFYLPSREGLHTIRYFAVDNTDNSTGGPVKKMNGKYDEYKHAVVKKIFTDLVGPSITHKYNGPNFPSRDTVFISPETELHLFAKDGESGLQYIAYCIDNNKEEINYDKPIVLKDGGNHTIEILGYDNVNNRNRKIIHCYVDNIPPNIHATFSIPSQGKKIIDVDTIGSVDSYPSYVTIFLAATDNTVGADKISYKINDNQEKLYLAPISGFIQNSINTIVVSAYDKLNNRTDQKFTFYIGN